MCFAQCSAKQTIIFTLDDFHHFTKRGRPTTLYNLLDALQAHHVRAAVVGITTDPNAVDGMEKRARSRFSHRKVVIPPPEDLASGDSKVPHRTCLHCTLFDIRKKQG
jgi:origin recognition complex subunit 4